MKKKKPLAVIIPFSTTHSSLFLTFANTAVSLCNFLDWMTRPSHCAYYDLLILSPYKIMTAKLPISYRNKHENTKRCSHYLLNTRVFSVPLMQPQSYLSWMILVRYPCRNHPSCLCLLAPWHWNPERLGS